MGLRQSTNRLVDRLLRKVGLLRHSRMGIQEWHIRWTVDQPVHVDLKLLGGQRVTGHVDPWWPNRNPMHSD